MNIVFCLDRNIITSLKAIVTSINHHSKRKKNYYVICPDEDFEIFYNFNKKYKLNITIGKFEVNDKVNKLIKRCNYYHGSKIANYSRFFIKKTFPNLKKIIYLDTDMLVLDDIGKLWDSVELNQNNFFAAPKYIWFHKLFYIKKLQYYFSYFNNDVFFNGGVFMTDLTYWNDKLYNKLYQITFELIDNSIAYTFTEPILNCLFPNFIQLDPAWNCSGYGNKKLYPLLKLRDYNIKPKIIHWSGHMKPWHKLNVHMEKLWYYYLNEPLQFIYLLYYDDNPSNGNSKLFLDTVSNINFNLVTHNVYQYEKFIDFKLKLGRNIKRHYCIKYFIEKNGIDSCYMFSDSYDVLFNSFSYNIINYLEENNIKVLYQNNRLGFKEAISNLATSMYKKDLFGFSNGINGGSFIGKGYNIINFYNTFFKYVNDNDHSDQKVINNIKNLSELISIDPYKYFLNVKSIYLGIKFIKLNFKVEDLMLLKNIREDIILYHFPGDKGRIYYNEVIKYKPIEKIFNIPFSLKRFILLYIYLLFLRLKYVIHKLINIIGNTILNFFGRCIHITKIIFNILFLVVLLKPFFIFYYYTAIFRKKIYITDKLYIKEGSSRKVYIHPLDNNKCIKISKKVNIFWNENMMNYRFHLLNKKHNSIATYYGTINTNLGIGLVFELIRDYDKNISRTIKYYQYNNSKFFKTPKRLMELNNKFINTKKNILNINIKAGDLKKHNMVVKKLNNDTFEIICIDGYFNVYT